MTDLQRRRLLAAAWLAGVPVAQAGRIVEPPPALLAPHAARRLRVWLPPGYDAEPERRFPVLYLHDGQNLFAGGEGSPVRWQADETAQRLVLAGAVEPMIIVAIGHAGASRIDEYTPWPIVRQGRPMGGGAAAYARYLVGTLKPAIDRHYRTRPEREHTALGGSSLGALISLWMLVHHADVFGAALAVSPSVWWADRAILAELARAPRRPLRLWIDVGLREGEGTVADARRLRDAAQALGWPIFYVEDPEGEHDETAWARRFEAMLRFLYAR